MTDVEEFSGFEVIRAAMEVEKRGHLFYAAAAVRAKSDLARQIFSWLAQDEISHLRALEKLIPRYQEGAFWEEEEFFLPYLRRFTEGEVFPTIERLDQVLAEPEGDWRALELAIEAEERFAEYFREVASRASSEEGKEAFGWLAAEEERHASVLRERLARLRGVDS